MNSMPCDLMKARVLTRLIFRNRCNNNFLLTDAQLEDAWDTRLKQLKAVVTSPPLRIKNSNYSIPGTAQRDFIEAMNILWMQELRKFFQSAIHPSNIDGYLSFSPCADIGIKI